MSLSAYIQGIRKVKIGTVLPSNGIYVIYNGGDMITWASNDDWEDYDTGLASGWEDKEGSGLTEFSIVTGNGFVGNAQRAYNPYNAANSLSLDRTTNPLINAGNINGKTFVMSIQYRSSGTLYWFFMDDSTGDVLAGTFPANTGNAIAGRTRTKFTTSMNAVGLYFQSAGTNPWFEIDEVRLYRLK
jgi:hypothetical protein